LLKDHKYALTHYRGDKRFSAMRFDVARMKNRTDMSKLNMSSVFNMFQDRQTAVDEEPYSQLEWTEDESSESELKKNTKGDTPGDKLGKEQ